MSPAHFTTGAPACPDGGLDCRLSQLTYSPHTAGPLIQARLPAGKQTQTSSGGQGAGTELGEKPWGWQSCPADLGDPPRGGCQYSASLPADDPQIRTLRQGRRTYWGRTLPEALVGELSQEKGHEASRSRNKVVEVYASTHPPTQNLSQKKLLCTLVTPQATSSTSPHRFDAEGRGSPARYRHPLQSGQPCVRGKPPDSLSSKPRTLPQSCSAAGPRGIAGWPGCLTAPSRFPPHSPLPRRRGLGSRAAAAAAAERLPVEPVRASGPPGPWPCPRPLAAVPELGWGPRPRLNGFCGLRARQQSRPRAPSRAMGRLRGARGRLPPGRLRAPPGRRAEGAFPGAGRGRRRALGFGELRSAWLGGAVLAWSLDWGRPAALGCARGSPDRGRSLARSLALVSRPPAGRGARSRAGSAGNCPPVGDICIARPRPARPHPQGGTRPAAVPPPLHLSTGWARCSQAVGQPAPREANLRPAPPPWLRRQGPRPALALSLRGYTAHTAPGVYPGTQLPGGKGRRAREQRGCAHLHTPCRVPPSHSLPATPGPA